MSDDDATKVDRAKSNLAARVGVKAARKLEARQSSAHVWFGLGMMGLIGWSVVIPTLLGAAIGSWLDRSHPGAFSWTLALLAAGILIGCANAWYWIANEDAAMHAKRGDDDG